MLLATLTIVKRLPSVRLQSFVLAASRVMKTERLMSPQVHFRRWSLLSADFVFWIWVFLQSRSLPIPPRHAQTLRTPQISSTLLTSTWGLHICRPGNMGTPGWPQQTLCGLASKGRMQTSNMIIMRLTRWWLRGQFELQSRA